MSLEISETVVVEDAAANVTWDGVWDRRGTEGRRFGRRRVNSDRCFLSEGFRSSSETTIGGVKTVGVGEAAVDGNESCDIDAVNEGNSIIGANATGWRNVRKEVSGCRKLNEGPGTEEKLSSKDRA